MTNYNFTRVKEQEDGNVKFWIEDVKNNITASLVNGHFPDELSIRIINNNKRIEINGHKTIMDKMSINDFERYVRRHIERMASDNNSYEKPEVFEMIEERPYIIQLIDKDEEVLQMEYDTDGLIIFTAFGGVDSPLIPADLVMKAIQKLLDKGKADEALRFSLE